MKTITCDRCRAVIPKPNEHEFAPSRGTTHVVDGSSRWVGKVLVSGPNEPELECRAGAGVDLSPCDRPDLCGVCGVEAQLTAARHLVDELKLRLEDRQRARAAAAREPKF